MGKRKPVHPGEVLNEDVIKPLGLSVTEAASRLGVARKTLSTLLNCRASLSPEMAVRIAKATKTSPESWLYMQAKLDLWMAIRKSPKVKDLKAMAV
ncbi:MAG TPA: addiction module antidote protein, HigA family [Nitrospirae bacterium]|nr:addiction module antidote protein, HigA family [Nitrospirota bacterium]HDK82370.1 addiction module antidote protein, HigA family [Nitrospirota bacterium]HDO26335.1 addiction module antidote protein, HigA family [Nitrospirota bacterium]